MIAPGAIWLSGALGAAVLFAPWASAEERLVSPFEDHFRITAGLLAASTTTNLRLDATDETPGTSISGEDDLGLRERSTLADVQAELRIRKRHRVRFGYFSLGRQAQAILTRQIRFRDDVYDITDRVQSQFDIRDFSTTYAYSFVSKDRVDVAASFGLHLLELDALAGVPARDINEEESQTAPIPALGLQATFRLGERWYVEAGGEYLSRKIGKFMGRFKNLRGAVLYRFNRNLAIGTAYTALDMDVISSDAGDSGRFQFENKGAELFVRLAF